MRGYLHTKLTLKQCICTTYFQTLYLLCFWAPEVINFILSYDTMISILGHARAPHVAQGVYDSCMQHILNSKMTWDRNIDSLLPHLPSDNPNINSLYCVWHRNGIQPSKNGLFFSSRHFSVGSSVLQPCQLCEVPTVLFSPQSLERL